MCAPPQQIELNVFLFSSYLDCLSLGDHCVVRQQNNSSGTYDIATGCWWGTPKWIPANICNACRQHVFQHTCPTTSSATVQTNFALAPRAEQFGDVLSKRLRALSGSLLKERQRIQCKGREKWGSWQRGLRWPGGKSSLMPVRVWASWELMKPTGSTANFSWNHLSGLANLSRLLRPPPVVSGSPVPPRYIHRAWRYQEVTVGTEGYFVPSWFAEQRVVSTRAIHEEIVWPVAIAQTLPPSIAWNSLLLSLSSSFEEKHCGKKYKLNPCEGLSMHLLVCIFFTAWWNPRCSYPDPNVQVFVVFYCVANDTWF